MAEGKQPQAAPPATVLAPATAGSRRQVEWSRVVVGVNGSLNATPPKVSSFEMLGKVEDHELDDDDLHAAYEPPEKTSLDTVIADELEAARTTAVNQGSSDLQFLTSNQLDNMSEHMTTCLHEMAAAVRTDAAREEAQSKAKKNLKESMGEEVLALGSDAVRVPIC